MAVRSVLIKLLGDDSDLSSKIDKAKRKRDELTAKAAELKLKLKGDREASLKLDQLIVKMDKIDTKEMTPDVDLRGILKANLELDKLALKMDKLDVKGISGSGPGIAKLGANLGALSNFAIPSLVGGLVAVSGQIATVTFGLGGLAVAAGGVVAPVLKAARAQGPLADKLAELDPLQRRVAMSLIGLGGAYHKFQDELKTPILDDFNKGIHLAEDLMGDVVPIAKNAGKALGGVLGQIDKEFQSGTWQNFFAFMEKNAGPDVRQLGTLFTDILHTLPPLATALHPVGSELISNLDTLTKFVGGLAKLATEAEQINNKFGHHAQGNMGNSLLDAGKRAFNALAPNIPGATQLINAISKIGGSSDKAAGGQNALAAAAKRAQMAAAAEQRSMDAVASAIDTVTNKILGLQDTELTFKQAQKDATKALRDNNHALDGNSNSALAAKRSLLGSTQAALDASKSQLTLNHSVRGASAILKNQIAFLATHAGHSRFAAQEVGVLIAALHRVPGNVSSTIHAKTAAAAAAIADILNKMAALNGMVSTVYVDYQVNGQNYVVPHHRHAAAGTSGAAPGWSWVGEQGPELMYMMGGETVVPSPQSQRLAAMGVLPGYASGTNDTKGHKPFHLPMELDIELMGRRMAHLFARALSDEMPKVQKAALYLARSVTRDTISSYNITGIQAPAHNDDSDISGPGVLTSGLVRASLGKDLRQIRQFAHNVRKLAHEGLNKRLLRQIIKAGPIEGAAVAEALANGPMRDIRAINREESQIARAAGVLGGVSGMALYNRHHRHRHHGHGHHGHHGDVTIHVHVAPTANKAEIGREIVHAIREYERRSGKHWRG